LFCCVWFCFCFCEELLSLLYPHTREIKVPRYVVARYLVIQQQHARALTRLSCCCIHSFILSHLFTCLFIWASCLFIAAGSIDLGVLLLLLLLGFFF
jgi:hypothetical protein